SSDLDHELILNPSLEGNRHSEAFGGARPVPLLGGVSGGLVRAAGLSPAARAGSGTASLRFFECILTMNCPVQRRAGVSPAQRALARERESKSAVGLYVFSVVGTSRCDVRAACSDATPSNAIVAQIFIPPAT